MDKVRSYVLAHRLANSLMQVNIGGIVDVKESLELALTAEHALLSLLD